MKDANIRNPGTLLASSTVTISTTEGSTSLDTGTSEGFTPTFSPFAAIEVNPTSYLTNELNVEYLFTVRAIGPIPQSSYLVLTVPDDIPISNKYSIESNCEDYFTSGVQDPDTGRNPKFSCDIPYNLDKEIRIRDLFKYSDLSDYPSF